MGIDFQMPEVNVGGALVLLLNYVDNRHFAYFRIRVASGDRNFAQLMVTRNGQAAKPRGEVMPMAFAPGTWYRVFIEPPQGDVS